MKKKTLAGLIALGVLIVPVLCYTVIVNKNSSGIADEPAFRTSNDIANEETVYLDDEAIALADSSGNTTSLRSEALRAYNLVNEQRTAAGLPALTWDSGLETVAAVRAQECSISFSHTRPNGRAWYTVNSAIQGGENLAFGYNDANSALNAWMNSPTHRENILYPTFTRIAISLYVSDNGTYYWAQEFGY
ncbi:MAG TPA: CAP domain-containing protein [Lachnospiraceae bacterium]|nr:CAP domain-containing protein [Lachnospiraceae bacterium]